MRNFAKTRLVPVALSMGLGQASRRMTRTEVPIFMLHRIRGEGVEGTSAESLERGLEWLRGSGGFHPVHLADVFAPEPLRVPKGKKAFALTFDDGYADQLEVAGPILESYDMPATVFLTSGFLDGANWMWWDQVEYAMEHARRPSPSWMQEVGISASMPTSDVPDPKRLSAALVEYLKSIPDDRRRAVISCLPDALEFEWPREVPRRFRPAAWEEARTWEARGLIRFGPHTVTHPVLARATDPVATWEIAESWARLVQKLAHPVPVFAFPNGRPGDFGPRELECVASIGLLGSVTSVPGVAVLAELNRGDRPVLPRYAFPNDLDELRVVATGLQSLLRGRRYFKG